MSKSHNKPIYGDTQYHIEAIIHPGHDSSHLIHEILDIDIPCSDKNKETIDLKIEIPLHRIGLKVFALNAHNNGVSYDVDKEDKHLITLHILSKHFPKIKIDNAEYWRVKLDIEYIYPNTRSDNAIENFSVLLNMFDYEPWHMHQEIIGYIPIKNRFQPEFTVTLPSGWEIIDEGCYIDTFLKDEEEETELEHRIISMKQGNKKRITFLLDPGGKGDYEKFKEKIVGGAFWYNAKLTRKARIFQLISHIFLIIGILLILSLRIGIMGYLEYASIISISISYLIALFAYYYTYMSLSGNGCVFTNKNLVLFEMIISVLLIVIVMACLIGCGMKFLLIPESLMNQYFFNWNISYILNR